MAKEKQVNYKCRHELLDVVRDIETYTRFLKNFGLRYVDTQISKTFDTPKYTQTHESSPSTLLAKQTHAKLEDIRSELGQCTRCGLSATRHHIVFGEGNPIAQLMLVGEAPGEEEDRTGHVFVGPAGELLERILAAMGLKRTQVYISNVVKCRPPKNRTPRTDEIYTCGKFLRKQIAVVHPQYILCLGTTAAHYLLNTNRSMSILRGHIYEHSSGARIMPTYHPSYLLRNKSAKKLVWQDVQVIMEKIAKKEKPNS